MMVGKVCILCTIGEVGEIVTLRVGQLLRSLLRAEQPIFNLVCNVAEIKTAYLLLGDMTPKFADSIDIMQQNLNMVRKDMEFTHNVTMSSTINPSGCHPG